MSLPHRGAVVNDNSEFDYDLIVIGSGPGGHRAAIQAAKLNRRVCVIEKNASVGGVCLNTGTIPSKSLRHAAVELSGYLQRTAYGNSRASERRIRMEELRFRAEHVVRHEVDVHLDQLRRNNVDVIGATAEFEDPHNVRLSFRDGQRERRISAEHVVIAVGTRVASHPNIPTDGKYVFDSDQILHMDRMPKRLVVLGAGVIGSEYASIFAALGVRVTLVDKRGRLLDFVDHEIGDHFAHQLRQNRVTLRLGEQVSRITVDSNLECPVLVELDSGKHLWADACLCALGREGATTTLNLQATGIEADSRGRISVNAHYQTVEPHIYAVGDVIGFPSLASTSMEQGRLAACHAFSAEANSVRELFPYGIYTVPEISIVGRSEQELTKQQIPYEIGKAYYREIARGQIIGDTHGLLKLLYHRETRQLLGVSIIGEGASELIHIGQSVMAFGGTIDYFVDTVFNYPTLAECYKTAAFDGLNRLPQAKRSTHPGSGDSSIAALHKASA